MNCLLCEKQLMRDTWSSLFTGKQDCVCKSCREGFHKISSSPVRRYVVGTELDGALDSIFCFYSYNSSMQHYFQRYKGEGDQILHLVFSQELRLKVPCIPIPSYQDNSFNRTFSHVEQLFCQNHLLHLLKKNDPTKQSSRNLAQRIQSANPFELIPGAQVPEKLFLVDDIFTTGVTMYQAAAILKKQGVKQVHGICLAETLEKTDETQTR
ncbi:hypothetical protein CF394_01225 [Tetzosporium hominis]|uniref:Phosphoribosyltransferase domain-containing protein n=1 Tax=Tetzosporium hominis TaxID=2020506 RepID=A0A264W643_9BACL|nr:phosphoribosyltransferase family protein [Tetzosporium hominis]OZS79072.1 hypothetical protein CF394_01225 [Tetzosporium hominis]